MTLGERQAKELECGRVWRAWTLGWLGAPVLAVINGAAREKLCKERVGELAAHQISTASPIALLAPHMWMLERRGPLPSRRTALCVGGTWSALTLLFELGLGRARRMPWPQLLRDYDLSKGRVWVLVPLWAALGLETVRVLAARGPAASRLDS